MSRRKMTPLRWASFAVAMMFLGLVVSGPRAEEKIDLNPSFSEIVRLSRPAATVVVGDSEIADATIAAGGAVVLTAKKLGVTNFIALDSEGAEIFRAILNVGPGSTTVRFPAGTGGSVTKVYLCAPTCRPAPEKESDFSTLPPGSTVTMPVGRPQ
jgi:hypothetical protein